MEMMRIDSDLAFSCDNSARFLPWMLAVVVYLGSLTIVGIVCAHSASALVQMHRLTHVYRLSLGVCPGWVNTAGAMDELEADAKRLGISEDELIDIALSRQALPGMQEPVDMASTYLFLASDAAANITGQTIHCDRGEMMD